MDVSELKRLNLSAAVNRHPWELARGKIVQTLLKKQSASYNTIIDFGSGDIYLLHKLELQKMAKEYYAIDNAYSEFLIQTLKTRYPDSRISLHGTINDIEGISANADCVLFLDVIEHCENDKELLHSVVSKKPPVGKKALVLVTVPAYQSLFSEHDKLLHHYRRYSLRQLKNTCREAGLTVSGNGYFFFSLLLLRIFRLFLEKINLSRPAKSIDNWKGGKVLSKFLSFFLWLDFKFCYLLNRAGIKLPGLSCYCICHLSPS
jgi:hypothetical protein